MTKIYIDYNNTEVSTNLSSSISALESANTYIKAPFDFSSKDIFASLLTDIKTIKNNLKNTLSWVNASKSSYANFDNVLRNTVNRIPKYNLKRKVSKVK